MTLSPFAPAARRTKLLGCLKYSTMPNHGCCNIPAFLNPTVPGSSTQSIEAQLAERPKPNNQHHAAAAKLLLQQSHRHGGFTNGKHHRKPSGNLCMSGYLWDSAWMCLGYTNQQWFLIAKSTDDSGPAKSWHMKLPRNGLQCGRPVPQAIPDDLPKHGLDDWISRIPI